MKKKVRSVQEQAVALTRVAAAARLQPHRPKAHASKTAYDRTKQKRLWQKDQEALQVFGRPYHSRAGRLFREITQKSLTHIAVVV